MVPDVGLPAEGAPDGGVGRSSRRAAGHVTSSGTTHPLASAILDEPHTVSESSVPSRSTSSFIRTWGPVVLVCLPIMWAALRAAAGNWVPIGDDAYFTVRSRDVLTSHHPLLGAWSSGSLDLTTPINNLGPLQLDLLAPFTRWTPMGGTAIGVAVVNIAAVVAIAWMMRR